MYSLEYIIADELEAFECDAIGGNEGGGTATNTQRGRVATMGALSDKLVADGAFARQLRRKYFDLRGATLINKTWLNQLVFHLKPSGCGLKNGGIAATW